MTMVKKETAEEKLLKIIEATKKAKGLSLAVSSPSAARAPQRRISISVQQINVVLFAALLAGFLFLVNEIRSGNMLLNQDVTIAADTVAPADTQSAALPQMKNISYYVEKISLRNIFQPYDKKAVEQKEAATQVTLQTKMSKYKIVGVAWLDVPESATVMIEDTAKHETRFLREGDKIEDVKVKTIYTDRVVFSYANEEITIKL
jgi:hypothetical protein